jgi:hypothetical protein
VENYYSYLTQQRKHTCNRKKKNDADKQQGSYEKTNKSDNSNNNKLKVNFCLHAEDKYIHTCMHIKIFIFLPNLRKQGAGIA